MNKKLGIIQLELGELTLENNFDEHVGNPITSQLSEYQKLIIKQALDGKKLIVISGKITDSSDVSVDLVLTIGHIEYSIPDDANVITFLAYEFGTDVLFCPYIKVIGDDYYIYS